MRPKWDENEMDEILTEWYVLKWSDSKIGMNPEWNIRPHQKHVLLSKKVIGLFSHWDEFIFWFTVSFPDIYTQLRGLILHKQNSCVHLPLWLFSFSSVPSSKDISFRPPYTLLF